MYKFHSYKSPISVNTEIGLLVMALFSTFVTLFFEKMEIEYFYRLKIILLL